jgi:malate dehydrogenase (oxaloacetate-decarboxylating)(NADP+)
LRLLVDLGFPLENIWVTDIEGVVYKGRTVLMDPDKARYAQETTFRSLAEVIHDADIFLGLSAANVLKADLVQLMAPRPIILALANPVPEILPEAAKAARDDVVIATGRADYPNQVNNSLCFPYIFRGALDCRASTINREMELAAMRALAELAKEPVPAELEALYGRKLEYGVNYFLPMQFDQRLLTKIAPAVVQAAMNSGVAQKPIEDIKAYEKELINLIL